MREIDYGYTRRFDGVSFEDALARATEALKAGGFGVLTEIDVKATMKKKLDLDYRDYRILGACNPELAHEALSQDLGIGLLLPCNVVLFQEDDGAVTVSVVKPESMFQAVGSETLRPLAREVDRAVRQVVRKLEELGAAAD